MDFTMPPIVFAEAKFSPCKNVGARLLLKVGEPLPGDGVRPDLGLKKQFDWELGCQPCQLLNSHNLVELRS